MQVLRETDPSTVTEHGLYERPVAMMPDEVTVWLSVVRMLRRVLPQSLGLSTGYFRRCLHGDCAGKGRSSADKMVLVAGVVSRQCVCHWGCSPCWAPKWPGAEPCH